MIGIIDYGAGNIASIKNAIERLGFGTVIISNPKDFQKVKKIIFPGQGRAGYAMDQLKKKVSLKK